MVKKNVKNKSLLLKQFNALKNVNEKLTFWRKTLKTEYIEYLKYLDTKGISQCDIFNENKYPLKEFQILPKGIFKAFGEDQLQVSNPQQEELNEYILGFLITEARAPNSNWNLFNYEDFKSQFEKELSSAPKKKIVIDNNLRRLETLVNSLFVVKNNQITEGNEFYKSYTDNLNFSTEVDYEESYASVSTFLEALNGVALGKFRIFLEEELAKVENKNTNNLKREEITIKEQLVILDYLGLLDKLKSRKNKSAKFISLLINKSEQNTREELSAYAKFRATTKANSTLKKTYSRIISMFKMVEMEDAARHFSELLKKL